MLPQLPVQMHLDGHEEYCQAYATLVELDPDQASTFLDPLFQPARRQTARRSGQNRAAKGIECELSMLTVALYPNIYLLAL